MKTIRVVGAAFVACGAVIACSSDPSGSGTTTREPTSDAGPNDDLNLAYNPTFEPDYNKLAPNPAANPVTAAQQDAVSVTPTTLEFASADADEVRYWEAGKIVVSPPGTGAGVGTNPLGFARRVLRVREAGGKVIVDTKTVGLEDLASGSFQVRFDPKLAKPVDLSKLDLQWAAEHLYQNGGPIVSTSGQPLVVNTPPGGVAQQSGGQPNFWGDIASSVSDVATDVANAVVSGANSLASAIKTGVNDLGALLPSSFSGALNLSDELNVAPSLPLFNNLNIRKVVNQNGDTPLLIAITGNGTVDTSLDFKPGFQVGVQIPDYLNPNPDPFRTWINVDSQVTSRLHFDAQLTATLESARGVEGADIQKDIASGFLPGPSILSAETNALFGDPGLKPAGTWKKTLYVSNPSTQTVFAGAVPVVLTYTMQLDLECGFEAQATVHADVQLSSTTNFKFSAAYDSSNGATSTTPTFTTRNAKVVRLDGSGSIAVTCGLIPRITTTLYDTAGLNVGLRGELEAHATFASSCAPSKPQPVAEIDLGLKANLSVEVGAHINVPGDTAIGASFGPATVWSTSTDLGSTTYPSTGIGTCTPLCSDGKKDGTETDVDCGGGACGGCLNAKVCTVNTDCLSPGTCNSGRCKVDPCGDRVVDGNESDVDCGGTTCSARCASAKHCAANADCDKGLFCSTTSKTCVITTCDDGVKDGVESGIDCGGPTCAKCRNGVASTSADFCESGASSAGICVVNSCSDRVKNGSETGVDCGSAQRVNCGLCPLGQSCLTNADCLDGYKNNYCGPGGVCAVNPNPNCFDGLLNEGEGDVDCGGPCAKKCDQGSRCNGSASCASNLCNAGICTPATCGDGVKNSDETDIDCGGTCGRKCVVGQGCATNKDCVDPNFASLCNRATNHCAPLYLCYDGVKNDGESGVDCGVACGVACANGQTCNTYADCASENCVNGTCADALGAGYVFVTAQIYSATFGGVAGADAACQSAASAVNLPGTYRAWLSDATNSAASRMLTHRENGYRTTTSIEIARTGAEMFGFSHHAPINVTEQKTTLANEERVWTGTSASTPTGDWCTGWTKPYGTTPPIGFTDASNSYWTDAPSPSFCDGQYHLYCVQQ